MGQFSVSLASTNWTCYTPQLQGQRLSLTFDQNAVATLSLEDTTLLQVTNTGFGPTVSVTMNFDRHEGRPREQGVLMCGISITPPHGAAGACPASQLAGPMGSGCEPARYPRNTVLGRAS